MSADSGFEIRVRLSSRQTSVMLEHGSLSRARRLGVIAEIGVAVCRFRDNFMRGDLLAAKTRKPLLTFLARAAELE